MDRCIIVSCVRLHEDEAEERSRGLEKEMCMTEDDEDEDGTRFGVCSVGEYDMVVSVIVDNLVSLFWFLICLYLS